MEIQTIWDKTPNANGGGGPDGECGRGAVRRRRRAAASPPDLAAQLAEALGLEASRADAFILDLFRAEAEALTGAADFFACAGAVLSRWGIAQPIDAFSALWHQIEVDEAVLSVVADLRGRGVFCGLASNQQVHRASRMSTELRYAELFDAEFYSCHVGHAKPSEAFFEAVVRSAELDPARTLFIDDRVENLEAAGRVGLQVAWFAPGDLDDGEATVRRLLGTHGL